MKMMFLKNTMVREGDSMVGRDSTSKITKKAEDMVLPVPDGIDPDWRTRIAIAKREMKEAKKARRGKRIAFKTHLFGP